MTPKEALDRIAILSEILVDVSKFHIMPNDGINEIRKLDVAEIYFSLSKQIKELEELKRYPTADEVCKALSGWFDEKFYYDVNQKEFYTKALNGQHSVVKLKKNEIHFGGWYTMPPHLITLIGRFYEAQE